MAPDRQLRLRLAAQRAGPRLAALLQRQLVYTDDGWTWVADPSEPWGWATYHYGRWTNLDGIGWVWVPGYTWAPAWVSWRYGGGYCGWAPLPPETTIGVDFGGEDDNGFHIGGDCDTAYDIGPGCYNFVPVIYLGASNYRPYYLNRYNNYIVINKTRNVTNIVVAGSNAPHHFGRVVVGGPSFCHRQRAIADSGAAGQSRFLRPRGQLQLAGQPSRRFCAPGERDFHRPAQKRRRHVLRRIGQSRNRHQSPADRQRATRARGTIAAAGSGGA